MFLFLLSKLFEERKIRFGHSALYRLMFYDSSSLSRKAAVERAASPERSSMFLSSFSDFLIGGRVRLDRLCKTPDGDASSLGLRSRPTTRSSRVRDFSTAFEREEAESLLTIPCSFRCLFHS